MKYEFKNDEELKLFISENIITTVEAAEILNCTRQNIDGMVKKKKITPVKQTQRDKLFLRSDILEHVKPSN